MDSGHDPENIIWTDPALNQPDISWSLTWHETVHVTKQGCPANVAVPYSPSPPRFSCKRANARWRATSTAFVLISTSSPIGRAIVGKNEGDEINVVTPNGTRNFEIVKLVTIHDEA